MSKRNMRILIGALIVLAVATVVAFVLLFAARSDIDDLNSQIGGLTSSSKSSSTKAETDLEGLRARVNKLEDEVKGEESEAEKTKKEEAKKEFDPNKPLLEGDVSVNALLKTVDLNADTANKNFSKIENEVTRLKNELDDEKQVSGD